MVFPLRKEKALRKQVEVTAETKAKSLPTLRMLMDAKNNIYLVATADSMTLDTLGVLWQWQVTRGFAARSWARGNIRSAPW